mgnify:FL=1
MTKFPFDCLKLRQSKEQTQKYVSGNYKSKTRDYHKFLFISTLGTIREKQIKYETTESRMVTEVFMLRKTLLCFLGPLLAMQIAQGAQNSQPSSNRFYTQPHVFMGKRFAYYAPGFTIRTAYGVGIDLTKTISIYNQVQQPFSQAISYPRNYWGYDQCSPLTGCYWQPRSSFSEAFVPISDYVMGTYNSDRYKRLTKNNLLKQFEGDLAEASRPDTQNFMAGLEEKMRSEIDVKVQNSIREQFASLVKKQNLTANESTPENDGLPESLYPERLILVHKDSLATDTDTIKECLLVEGDILKIVSYRNVEFMGVDAQNEIILTAKVVRSLPMKNSCRIGSEVEIDFVEILAMENTFQRKVEEGLVSAIRTKLIKTSIQEVKPEIKQEPIQEVKPETKVVAPAIATKPAANSNPTDEELAKVFGGVDAAIKASPSAQTQKSTRTYTRRVSPTVADDDDDEPSGPPVTTIKICNLLGYCKTETVKGNTVTCSRLIFGRCVGQ